MHDELKRIIIEKLIHRCPFIDIRLDDPKNVLGYFTELGGDGFLRLQLGNDPKVLGIPDLVFTDEGWSGTLVKAGRSRVAAFVTWRSIVQITLYQGEQYEAVMSWPLLPKLEEEKPKSKGVLHIVREQPVAAAMVKALEEQPVPESERKCLACASCFMEPDDMNFTCGHKDAGPYGIYIHHATAPESERKEGAAPGFGHCGPARSKFKQHPDRHPNGNIKGGE